MSNGNKTTAQSTTEQPEANRRKRPSPSRSQQSGKRNQVNQNLEEMKDSYNATGEVENYSGDDLEREVS